MNTETLRDHIRRVLVLGTVVGAQFVWSASPSVAETVADTVVESGSPIMSGPGVAAVAVGIGGFIVGLVRRRKSVAAKAQQTPAVPLPGPRQPVGVAAHQD
ncbi:hypothetical protein [Actinokineospora xionganensis]|uniref:Secreted protein with PEP-CTERM sorting signal n=1 Tax=Actinokineospora xionganensis TaxID=2684470 RepID=A0ABR7LFS7_9PSEU|nr:hypothetical protein [Actinokineospora xionganensis]MBC6451588.1 hypothetical protein [Actinokineospora xionganensis]